MFDLPEQPIERIPASSGNVIKPDRIQEVQNSSISVKRQHSQSQQR
jgi:hypothetical protein